MKEVLIAIAGGSGAGKSTLCTALMDKYPDRVGLVQLDDYLKPQDKVPTLAGRLNYDHPDAVNFDQLVNDLSELAQGRAVVINTKNPRLNPDFTVTRKRIPVLFQPKEIMLVEGFLVLHDERVRNLLDGSIWLEADQEARYARREHFKDDQYDEEVLRPMHKQFAEPTKSYAEHIIYVTPLSKEQVLEKAEEVIFESQR